MRSLPIVVADPLVEKPAEMPFSERNQPIQAFAPHRPDHAFAVRVGLWRPHRRLQHAEPHRSDRTVDSWSVDRIAVVDQKAMPRLARDRGTTLLDRPVRRRMLGHVPMDDPARADVEHDEHIQDAEANRDRSEEVTREDRVRVIPYERGPALGGSTTGTVAGAGDTCPPCAARQSGRVSTGVRPRSAPRPRSGSPGPW